MSKEIRVCLSKGVKEQWELLSSMPNEMRVPCTYLKPLLDINIYGLDMERMYEIKLHFENVDNLSSSWEKNKWKLFEESVLDEEPKQILHPNGLKSGKEWMRASFFFYMVKLTTYGRVKNEYEIPLHLYRKYIPVLSVYESESKLVKKIKIIGAEFITTINYKNIAIGTVKGMIYRNKGLDEIRKYLKNPHSDASVVSKQSTSIQSGTLIPPPAISKSPKSLSSGTRKRAASNQLGNQNKLSKLLISTSFQSIPNAPYTSMPPQCSISNTSAYHPVIPLRSNVTMPLLVPGLSSSNSSTSLDFPCSGTSSDSSSPFTSSPNIIPKSNSPPHVKVQSHAFSVQNTSRTASFAPSLTSSPSVDVTSITPIPKHSFSISSLLSDSVPQNFAQNNSTPSVNTNSSLLPSTSALPMPNLYAPLPFPIGPMTLFNRFPSLSYYSQNVPPVFPYYVPTPYTPANSLLQPTTYPFLNPTVPLADRMPLPPNL